jgi:processive 1,2-diacylglycerol beta-glucosyltransferase
MATCRRILILSADVGEGHEAAARALAAELERGGDIDVVCSDGLRALGRFLHHLIRDGYRLQIRYAPWSFSLLYALFRHLPAARAIGKRVLFRLGRRRLGRLLGAHPCDVVVSTHPAITCVLGEMRRRRQLAVPLCAPITDLADWSLWASPGADLHLVPHEAGIAPVESIAGLGSARLVRPLVAPAFLAPRDREASRACLALPRDRKVIVISGGGWGVGDPEGAVRSALSIPGATVVCVCGHNTPARLRLERTFSTEPRVRVLGFTERMGDLLHAADALVHSTGGVTSLEALACGCPVIAYGAQVAHIKLHNKTLERLGLARVCSSRDELARALVGALEVRPGPRLAGGEPAGPLVAELDARVLPIPAWRLGLGRAASVALTAVALGGWGFATDDAYSLAARALDFDPIHTIATPRRAVALVVEATPRSARAVAVGLRRRGARATFAFVTPPSGAQLRGLRRDGDALMPQLRRAPTSRWLSERARLRRTAAELGLRSHFPFLLPDRELSPGEYLVANTAGGRPVAGAVRVDAGSRRALPPLRAGQVVVVRALSPSRPDLREVESLLGALAARGLSTAPLVAPVSAATGGDAASRTTPAATATSPATIAMPESGVAPQPSPTRSGATRTGTST